MRVLALETPKFSARVFRARNLAYIMFWLRKHRKISHSWAIRLTLSPLLIVSRQLDFYQCMCMIPLKTPASTHLHNWYQCDKCRWTQRAACQSKQHGVVALDACKGIFEKYLPFNNEQASSISKILALSQDVRYFAERTCVGFADKGRMCNTTRRRKLTQGLTCKRQTARHRQTIRHHSTTCRQKKWLHSRLSTMLTQRCAAVLCSSRRPSLFCVDLSFDSCGNKEIALLCGETRRL